MVADPMRNPRSGGAVLYLLRIRTDLPLLPPADAEKVLADLGRRPRLRTDRYARSPPSGPHGWGSGTSDHLRTYRTPLITDVRVPPRLSGDHPSVGHCGGGLE